MKKFTLFIVHIITTIVVILLNISANAQNNNLLIKSSFEDKALTIRQNISRLYSVDTLPYDRLTPWKTSSILGAKLIGSTCYDLQSTNSMGRQIINHGDGTLSFIWTIDDACTASHINRGSGWNYWNGTSLAYPLGVAKRLEPVRTGFSQIGILGNGQEVIMAHKNAPHDFMIGKNSFKGDTAWTNIFNTTAPTLTASVVPGYTGGPSLFAFLGRIAIGGSNGNSIHLISSYDQHDTIKGITGPMVYSRSTDGGLTWDQQSILLPGYDSTRTLSGVSEAYSIDALSDTIAILHGGIGEDVTLWKSIDNGTTWTKLFVDSFPLAPSIDLMGGPTDTVTSNDGAMSVVVAPDGEVHATFSTERVLNDTSIGNGQYSVFFGDAGLVYWNDNVKQKINIPIALADIDATKNNGNSNGKYDVGIATTILYAALPPEARYGNRALLSIPSIAVDSNNVFIIFSLPTDGDSTSDGQSFRDIWIVASQDGGGTWGPVQNITCTKSEEEYFASLAKRVDNYLHILYQSDGEPGNSVQHSELITQNEINYIIVDKIKVLTGTANCSASGMGINEQSTPAFNLSEIHPNPATSLTFIDLYMKESSVLNFTILNSLGQTIYLSENYYATGKHTLIADVSRFPSGLYFYAIQSAGYTAKGKIIVNNQKK